MGKKFVTKTAQELLSTVMEPKEMVVHGLIPQGVVILAGPQKIGKSFLALDICISIATGRPILERDTMQGECLYLALEDNYRRLQSRLLRIEAVDTDFLHFAIASAKIGEGLEEQIEAFYQEHPNLRLVVIDVMQLVRKKMTSNYSSEYAELAGLRELANRLGISILIVMHTKKSRDRDPLNNIYGGGGFVSSADAVLVLSQEHRGGGNCVLFCTGREIESVEITIHFDSEAMRWEVVSDPTSKDKKESILLAAVYIYIREKIHFEGSATTLVDELKSVCDYKFYANRVTRDLYEEGHKLTDYGIIFTTKRNHYGRLIVLHYFAPDTQDDPTVTKTLYNRAKLAI